jgi:hypothetical protein
MKENEAAVARGCSAYSLAGAYSDPINNEPAGKENLKVAFSTISQT